MADKLREIEDLLSQLRGDQPTTVPLAPGVDPSVMQEREITIPLAAGESPSEELEDSPRAIDSVAKADVAADTVINTPQEANAVVESPNAPEAMSQEVVEKPEEKEDPLASAQRRDQIMDTLNMVSQGFAHFDAANPYAKLKPIKEKGLRTDAVDQFLKQERFKQEQQRQALLDEFRKQQMDATKRRVAAYEKQVDQSAELSREKRAERREQSKLKRESLQTERDRRSLERDERQIERYTKMAEGSDQYKAAEKKLTSTSTIRELLKDAKTQGGQSLAMLGPQVARNIAGEVGVMTDKDVTRYVQNPSLVGSLKDTLAKIKDGKISEVSYDNLNRLVNIMERKAIDNRAEAYRKRAIQLSRNSDLEMEDALEKLDPNYAKSPGGYEVERKGKKYRWDGIGKYRLIRK